MGANNIVSCAIHPGIGIARIGNSPDGYFIGPEAPGLTPNPTGGFKDAQGRIKRQAAKFRIYGLDEHGAVVAELESDHVTTITWTVRLANKKAAWYDFDLALDTPEAAGPPLIQSKRRNVQYKGNDRRKLIIDPGARSIGGRNTKGPNPHYQFDTGTFLGKTVPLGELRTDADGGLLVFGGIGQSSSVNNARATTFGNNDGWHDDTSDGPVTAHVTIEGKAISVTPAWVVIAPPDYAPGIDSVVTLYDLAYQTYLQANPRQAPQQVSFARHIYPLLARISRVQWVNQGFFAGFGWGAHDDFLAPATLAVLASNAPAHAAAREAVFKRFRNPNYHTMEETALPPIYGDSFDSPPKVAQQYLTVTPEQYRQLSLWAQGHFQPDWNPAAPSPQRLEDLPIKDRPQALDEAALAACLGGPFHPGCEVTWPMRHPSLYSGFCRLNVRADNDPERDYGDVMTPTIALAPDGPLHKSGPGDLTRWMAVPWQTDTASCGAAYTGYTLQPYPLPNLPTFWPARVPNKVLTQQAYQRIMDGKLAPADRHAAFQTRERWYRHLDQDWVTRMNQFVADWPRVGIVTRQPGPSHDPTLPSEMHVENGSEFPEGGGSIRLPQAPPPLHDPHTTAGPRSQT